MTEQEEIRKLKLLNLIVGIIVEATLRDLYSCLGNYVRI